MQMDIHKLLVSKKLGKEKIVILKLKNVSNKISQALHLWNYDKQRNLVLDLNKKRENAYLNKLSVNKNTKPIWKTCKPYFYSKSIKFLGIIKICSKESFRKNL